MLGKAVNRGYVGFLWGYIRIFRGVWRFSLAPASGHSCCKLCGSTWPARGSEHAGVASEPPPPKP